MSGQEALAWEAENRQRAAIAAFAAAIFTIVGVLLTTLGQPGSSEFDDKIVTVVDAMGRTAAGETIPPGRISAYTVDIGQSPGLPIAGAVLFGLGSLAIYFAMAYLFRAVRARKPEFQQIALVMAAIGAVGFGLGRAISEIARYLGAADFVDAADKSNSAASDALSPSASLIGQVIWQAAALALGFAFVLIALNAMRVGLLTRFMGVLGIIVGVLFVIPLGPLAVVQPFWLVALAALYLGRWPNGMPPAWESGKAEPWPSQQELREQRERAKAGGKPAREPEPEPEPEPAAATAGAGGQTRPHPSSKKRKRKRRR
jgi:MFS family permease